MSRQKLKSAESPEAQMAAYEVRLRKQLNLLPAVPYTEEFKFPGSRRHVLFTAASYEQWLAEACPFSTEIPLVEDIRDVEAGIPLGRFRLRKFELPLVQMSSPYLFGAPRPNTVYLSVYQRTAEAWVHFTDKIGIPSLITASGETWMSLTPNEILTQRGQIRRAKGHVGMAGMGLGWAAKSVLERKSVKSLTVYDICPEVLDYFGSRLQKIFGDRLKLVEADAYTVDWKQFDVSLWDIWPGYGNAADDLRYWAIRRELESLGKTCLGWGDNIYGGNT